MEVVKMSSNKLERIKCGKFRKAVKRLTDGEREQVVNAIEAERQGWLLEGDDDQVERYARYISLIETGDGKISGSDVWRIQELVGEYLEYVDLVPDDLDAAWDKLYWLK
jgi:hypothetical protein